jgi:hypothetical protein
MCWYEWPAGSDFFENQPRINRKVTHFDVGLLYHAYKYATTLGKAQR